MTTVKRATSGRKLKSLSVAVAALVAAPAALAEPMFQVPFYRDPDMSRYSDNYVELGVGHNSADSFKFREWNGLSKEGVFGIANFNWASRDAQDDRKYWHVFGFNLGQDTRQLGAESGVQGSYGLRLSYDQIERNQFDSTQFIHDGLGTDHLTLPAGFAGIDGTTAQPPANAGNIAPFLHSYDIKQDRKIIRLDGKTFLARRWDFTVNVREDQRDGTRLTGAVIGNSGGNPRSVIVPYPLDDKTHQLEVKLAYTGEKGQLQMGYYWSGYRNSVDSLTWQNPYTAIAGWDASAGFPTGEGRLGLAPSNNFNQINATGAYAITPTTRFNGTFAYGRMTQNDEFLPYTVNPTLAASVTTPLPRSSLDGRIDTTLVDLALSMRPATKLGLRARYHFDDHNNKTPQAQYLYIGGDSMTQPASPVNASQARTNLPIGTRENKASLDADYHVTSRTLLRGAYDWKRVEYLRPGFESRDSTTNNTLTGEVRRTATDALTGGLRYTYDQRRGSKYNVNAPFEASYDPTFATNQRFDNIPTLRHFFINDYDKNNVRAFGNIDASETVSVQLMADWYKIDYKQLDCGPQDDPLLAGVNFQPTCQGRTKDLGQSYTLDGQWTPREGLSAYAFYTLSLHNYDQLGQSFSGAPITTKLAQSTDPGFAWTGKTRYTDNTLGVGLRVTTSDQKHDYGAQYVFNDSRGRTQIATGPGITPAASPIPDTRSKLSTFQLYGKWQYSKHVVYRFNFWREVFSSVDWAYDNTVPWTTNNVLLTGQTSPKYNASVVGVSVAFVNW